MITSNQLVAEVQENQATRAYVNTDKRTLQLFETTFAPDLLASAHNQLIDAFYGAIDQTPEGASLPRIRTNLLGAIQALPVICDTRVSSFRAFCV